MRIVQDADMQLPHRHSGPIGKHPSGNVHRGQLLEQKLGSVGDMDLRDAVLVVAKAALEETLLQFTVEVLVNRLES